MRADEPGPLNRAFNKQLRQTRAAFGLLRKGLPAEHHQAVDDVRTLVEDAHFETRRAVQELSRVENRDEPSRATSRTKEE